jgi:hypothetical protein
MEAVETQPEIISQCLIGGYKENQQKPLTGYSDSEA